MTRYENSIVNTVRTEAEVRAGSALSLAAIALSRLVGDRTIGPANADRHLPDGYPLNPVYWRVTHTTLGQISISALAYYHGISEIPPNLKPWRPKDLPDSGINQAPADSLAVSAQEDVTPSVLWAHRGRILAAAIPVEDLEEAQDLGEFWWAMRFAGEGTFGAGLVRDGNVVATVPTRAMGVVPVAQVPNGIPGY
jgi:hypothetical protein